MICTVMSGIIATSATIPNASVITLPPAAVHAPIASGSMNVAVSGPDATPPESNAMAVNVGGTKNVRASAMRYPGTTKYRIGAPVSTRTIANPFASATAMDRLMPIAFAEIAPEVSSSTCLLRMYTAGSASMMNQPMSIASGTSSHESPCSTIAPPST